MYLLSKKFLMMTKIFYLHDRFFESVKILLLNMLNLLKIPGFSMFQGFLATVLTIMF